MSKAPSTYKYKRAIEIIDWIQWTGFPNKKNVTTLENLVLLLQGLAPQFKEPVFSNSIKEIVSSMQKIKTRLKKEGEIPVRLYILFNGRLIVFKENLLFSLYASSGLIQLYYLILQR